MAFVYRGPIKSLNPVSLLEKIEKACGPPTNRKPAGLGGGIEGKFKKVRYTAGKRGNEVSESVPHEVRGIWVAGLSQSLSMDNRAGSAR